MSFAHPLGHLPELKGYFSVFSCSYREGSPAVVSSCFSPPSGLEVCGCWLCADGTAVQLSRTGTNGGVSESGLSTNQSRQPLF